MKINRRKRVNRILTFFKNNFGFLEPYQVLVDGTFCQAAIKANVSVRDELIRYMGGNVKLLTTCCAVLEIEKLGNIVHDACQILKRFAVHSCGHEKEPRSAFWCFMDMVSDKNKNRYMIATQDEDMRVKLRRRIAIPLLYIYHQGLVLEKPLLANKQKAESIINSRLRPSDHQMMALKKLKKKILGVDDDQTIRRSKKRIKGANPLSCKKKKKTANNKKDNEMKKENPGRSRKRLRIRTAAHIKEHLANTTSSSTSRPSS